MDRKRATPPASSVRRLIYGGIRRLSLPDRLHLARRILDEAAAEGAGESQPRSLLDLDGFGAELWLGRDAQRLVDHLRLERPAVGESPAFPVARPPKEHAPPGPTAR